MNTATDKQRAVLDFIKTFQIEKGYPPTRSEISAHFGFKSDNSAHDHLQRLVKKGAIEITRGVSRGIKVLAP